MQLVHATRTPVAATREHALRVDYEYERAGTAAVFLFCEPLGGWREVSVRERRTKLDWTQEVAALLAGRYAACDQVTLVCDDLNTHTAGAFYEPFEPERARELVRRLEFRYTPKHGSWLNVAENEMSAMTRQVGPPPHRRLGHIARQDRRWVHGREHTPALGRLAHDGRGRPSQAQVRLSIRKSWSDRALV